MVSTNGAILNVVIREAQVIKAILRGPVQKTRIVSFDRLSVQDYETPPLTSELTLQACDDEGETHLLILEYEALLHLVALSRKIDVRLPGAFRPN